MLDGLSKEAYVPPVGRKMMFRRFRTTARQAMDRRNPGAVGTKAFVDRTAHDGDRARHRRLRDGKRSRR